jgi:hypothetical protein
VGITLSTNFHYFYTPCDLTVIFVCATSNADDAGLTIDINDDGTGVIAGVSAADADVPGTWKAKHMGGTNDAVTIAAGSKVSLDANNAAADSVVSVQIWALTGEVFS